MANEDMNTRDDATDEAADERRESGLPGGGAGRRDEVGHTGVYPLSASQGASEDASVVAEGAVGQGDRGVEGYRDSGDSGFDTWYEPQAPTDDQMTGTTPADEAGAGGI